MGILSKLLKKDISMPYNCYEVGHTWTPFCTVAALETGYITFKQAIRLYAPLYLLTQIYNRRYDFESFKKTFQSIVRSACFLGFNAFSFIAIFCFIRRIAGRFYYTLCAYFPAFLASAMALLIEREGRRGALALYVMNIASETIFKMAVSRGIVSPVPKGEIIIFSISLAIFLYLTKTRGYSRDPVAVAFRFILGTEEAKAPEKKHKVKAKEHAQCPKVLKLLPCDPKTVAKSSLDSGLQWLRSFRHIDALLCMVQKINAKLKHPSCPHESSCLVYVAKGAAFPFCLGWISHLLARVASGSKFWLNNPKLLKGYIVQTRSIKFGLFLCSLSALYKLACCMLRWTRNTDDAWHALPCGLLAGLSMFCFPSPTLSLYVMWKVVEMLYCIGVKNGFFPWVQATITFMYASSTALLFYAALLEPHNMRPSYLRFLSQVTDRKFDQINRLVLDIFGTNASQMYRNFFPKLDPKYISRPFQETILVWL